MKQNTHLRQNPESYIILEVNSQPDALFHHSTAVQRVAKGKPVLP